MSRLNFAPALAGAFLLLALPTPATAQREAVLKQVDVPHNYYWREMYVPQLTMGPSSLAWSPDGKELVYSMGGSLWRQEAGSGIAEQITAGPGYDYQPDWSPDGRTIVFARYRKDAIELWTLDLSSGVQQQLTSGGAVNLEPRFSPDGSKIAFVSTKATRRFRIFTASMSGPFEPVQFSPERKSGISRYYYSAFDHELSPAWSPDGKELLYLTNPEDYYGSGSLWRRAVAGGDPVLVREEETSWRARPDWAKDGKRIVWASYAGRQWHQLWLTTPGGKGDPLPLTFGEFDATSARWSPDGRHVAYISNEHGDGEIRVMDLPGGATRTLAFEAADYLQPMGALDLTVTGPDGSPVPARVSVIGSDGRAYGAEGSWMHANETFDRKDIPEEEHYFHLAGSGTLVLPAGEAEVTVWRGLENRVEHRKVTISATRQNSLTVPLTSIALPALKGWVSGDVHVHMNYGGNYRNTPERMIAQARAEDLDVVFNTIVNKEERVPDVATFSPQPDPASTADALLVPAQEYHTSYWGHLGVIGLSDHLLLPGFSAYANTGLASLYPDNIAVARLAHEQGALVGYVHPFDPGPAPNTYSTHAVPVSAALGAMDYYETVGFSDQIISSDIWYRLLNLGFRIAAAGGTDAMANYASLHGPVGLARTYVLPKTGSDTSPAGRRDAWIEGLRAGHSFATNGPLLAFTLDGKLPGDSIALPKGGGTLRWDAQMASIAGVDHVEVVQNGKVVATLKPGADGRAASGSGSLKIATSGWVLLRAWTSDDRPEVLDMYPYATTTPVYVTVEGAPPRSPEDARYMLDWLDLIEKSAGAGEYNDDAERAEVMGNIARARAVFEGMR
ncbi:CehA/McbA family metallohydrolase [Erythrobacter sp. SG61-1L]|uniref:CehA/McbA family metallohydrolase n=1 Tax=Erythrobacter sp. SG61-1L TaxID=1603897 RepID=UPI0006C9173A|nr:CehA/McbA family metallohydrolase [Erythrobacter sp. SG61-1L]